MTAAFNRRMRKTARTVVWEGWRAKSRHLDPIVVQAFQPAGFGDPQADVRLPVASSFANPPHNQEQCQAAPPGRASDSSFDIVGGPNNLLAKTSNYVR